MGGGASKPALYGVNLHVYDLVRRDSLGGLFGDATGMRALHTGVEVFVAKRREGRVVAKKPGVEYALGAGAGVWEQVPRAVPRTAEGGAAMEFRETICMGACELTPAQLRDILASAKAEWPGGRYNTLKCNCNHFSDALVFTLLQKHIPERINRLANTASATIGMIGGLFGGLASAINAVGVSVAAPTAADGRSRPEIEELPA